jgi:hypothetical protein
MTTPVPSSDRVLIGLLIVVLIASAIRAWYY